MPVLSCAIYVKSRLHWSKSWGQSALWDNSTVRSTLQIWSCLRSCVDSTATIKYHWGEILGITCWSRLNCQLYINFCAVESSIRYQHRPGDFKPPLSCMTLQLKPMSSSVNFENNQWQAQLSWDRLKEAQLSNLVLTHISLAQKGQLREDQLSNSILTLISFAQKSLHSHQVPKSR